MFASPAPTPAGRLEATPTGSVLALDRRFDADVEDVWASISEPDRLALWLGEWSGRLTAGAAEIRWTAEDGKPTEALHVLECTPPRRLVLLTYAEDGRETPESWHLTIDLAEDGAATTLTLRHRLDAGALPSTVGPGWEFYLDRLVAARERREPMPFAGYGDDVETYYRILDAAVPTG